MASEAEIRLEELRFRLHGGLFREGDLGYERASAPFRQRGGGRPRLVARCCAVEDVVAVLVFAQERGLALAVRGGGHAAARRSGGGGGLGIDLCCLCEVEVDSERRVARVGGGAAPAAIERAARRQGFVATPWLEGRPCPGLLAAQLVSDSGEIMRMGESESAGPLARLRSGGAVGGVVTAVELRLRPVPA